LDCTDIIQVCEAGGGFRSFQAGKNNNDARQLLVSQETADAMAHHIDWLVVK
jgi:hypothetical protein